MEKGRIIVVEGACDGIGKSTQFELLKNYFIDSGYDVYTHHFPSYDTYYGMPATKYLSGDLGNPKNVNPYVVHDLFAIDRAIVNEKEIKPALEDGKVVLLDRYTTSTLMYQSSVIEDLNEREKFIDFMADYEYNKLGIVKPDCVLFLYASFDMAKKLREGRTSNDGVVNDVHERDNEYMKGVYDNSVFVAKKFDFDFINSEENGQMKSINDIHLEIIDTLKKKKLILDKNNI